MNNKHKSQSTQISRRQFLKKSFIISSTSAVCLSFPQILSSKPKSIQLLHTINGFINPYNVTVNSTGTIYVTDAGGYCVKAFDKSGNFLFSFGSAGSEAGKLNYPQGISVDDNDDLFVVDSNNGRISKFSKTGDYITSFGSIGGYAGAFYTPKGIIVAERIYVCNTRNHCIYSFDKQSHQLLALYGDIGEDPINIQKGSTDYKFRLPTDIAVSSEGNLYIVDSKHGQIKVLDAEGKFIFKFGSNGSDEGQMNSPEGICFDRNQNIFVCDSINKRIQKFDINGNFISSLNLGLKKPTSIFIDKNNTCYIIDSELKQLSIYNLS